MTASERALTWSRDALVVIVLFAAPLVWGKWGVPQASLARALLFSLLAMAWVIYLGGALLVRRELTFLRSPLNLPVALLVLVALASTAWASVNQCRSLREVFQLLTGAMLLWLIAAQPGSPWRRRLYVAALLAGVAVTSWLGAREYVVQSVVGRNPSWRIFATFLNPNELAGYLGMFIPLAAAAFLAWRPAPIRIVVAFAAGLAVVALALTGSRGGWLAFAAGMFLFGLLAGIALRRTRLALAVAAAILGLALVMALTVAPLRVRLVGSLTGERQVDMFRYLTWKSTQDMILARPGLGFGPGAFEFAFPMYARAGFTRMAHQNYLQVGAEMGLPGLLAFLWMLGAGLWVAARAFRRLREREERLLCAAAIAGLVVFCLHSLVEYGWYIGAIQVGVFALMGLAANAAAPVEGVGRGFHAPPPSPRAGAKGRRASERPPHRPHQPQPPAQPPAEALLRLWRRRVPLSRPAAWGAVVGVAVVGLVLAGYPVRTYAAEEQVRLGRMAEHRGYLTQATQHYRQAVRLVPGCGEYHRHLGRALGAPRGLENLQRAIALEPTNSLNYLLLAQMYEALGPWDEAAAHYQRALELNHYYLRAHRGLAQLEARRGRPQQALALYQRMIEIEASPYERYRALEQRIDPEYAYAHYALGRAALERGEAAAARAALERALEVLRQREEIGAPLIRAQQAVGEYSPALDRQLAELRARILWRLAQAQQRLGEEQQAASLRAQAVEIEPGVRSLVEREPSLVEGGKNASGSSRG